MNDSEIIKALKHLRTSTLNGWREKKITEKDLNTISYALDLINRQQAEIDRLNVELKAMSGAANGFKAEVERLTQENNALNGNTEKYIKECENRSQQIAEGYRKEIKSEAVREFAEKLKKFAMTERARINQRRHVDVSYVRVYDIDRLLEEMGCNDG